MTVRGTVLKVSTVKPLVLQLNFQCMKCATKFPRVFCDGKFSPPVSCSIQGCKSRTFIPMRSTAKLMDFQKIRQVINKLLHYPLFMVLKLFSYCFQIRIQELASGESHEEGRVPRTIECELTEDLVDCCIPGETVTVTGIVKVLNNYMDVGGGTIFEKLIFLCITSFSKPCGFTGSHTGFKFCVFIGNHWQKMFIYKCLRLVHNTYRGTYAVSILFYLIINLIGC